MHSSQEWVFWNKKLFVQIKINLGKQQIFNKDWKKIRKNIGLSYMKILQSEI